MQKYIKDLHSLVADIPKFCLMFNMINFNPSDELSGSVLINSIFYQCDIFDISFKDFIMLGTCLA